MKSLSILLFFFFAFNANSQSSEFTVYQNGLIYSEKAVGQLKHIVDSLNLKFKTCDANKAYRSNKQATGHFISLSKGNILKAKADLERNIPFAEFKIKYPDLEIDENLLVVKYNYLDYDKNAAVELSNIELSDRKRYSIRLEDPNEQAKTDGKLQGKWVFKHYKKTSYSSENIDAFYFVSELESIVLPTTYSRIVQYSECLVDTTARVFYDNAIETGMRLGNGKKSKVSEFLDYVNTETKRPEFDYEKYHKYYSSKKQKDIDFYESQRTIFYDQYQVWDSLRNENVEKLRIKDPNFIKLYNIAVEDAMQGNGASEEFEYYVKIYGTKHELLELKRKRRVVGGCSQDSRPREHALDIALLSAETVKWEIFLRSHLDIMNDRFDRVSDGSYAYGARNTYIKELEVLDINVPDLILGIALRIENPAENHYFGSISRIGRALSESKNALEVEARLLTMISDNTLDDYNRVLMYYLFDNYNHYLADENVKRQNIEKLKTAVSNMPAHISSRIKFEKM